MIVAIVGTGLIGTAWALVFARAGHEVRLYDGQPGTAEKAFSMAGERLKELETADLVPDAAAVSRRIRIAGSLSAAVDGAFYVQESVLERIDVKRSVFSELDAAVGPETVLGSSSSGIPASAYTDHIAARERCLVAHPVNPPYLIPVVELVPAPWTSAQTMAFTKSLMRDVGQAPVVLSREIEGFALNRLQGALLMEAWKLYEEGIMSLHDIDLTVSSGLGLRWAFMGPFETIDLNAPGGIADYAQRLGPLFAGIAASRTEPQPWPAELVGRAEAERRSTLPAVRLADRAAWRDRMLMALSKWKAQLE